MRSRLQMNAQEIDEFCAEMHIKVTFVNSV